MNCRTMIVVCSLLAVLAVRARGEEGCSIPGAVFDIQTGVSDVDRVRACLPESVCLSRGGGALHVRV